MKQTKQLETKSNKNK